jgi:hypothetical protein
MPAAASPALIAYGLRPQGIAEAEKCLPSLERSPRAITVSPAPTADSASRAESECRAGRTDELRAPQAPAANQSIRPSTPAPVVARAAVTRNPGVGIVRRSSPSRWDARNHVRALPPSPARTRLRRTTGIDLNQLNASRGQRAGLVEHEAIGPRQSLDRMAARHQNAAGGERTGRHGQCAAGVPSESAQGQLTTSTATKIQSARDGSIHHQASAVTTASSRSATMKCPATRSAISTRCGFSAAGPFHQALDGRHPRRLADALDAHHQRACRIHAAADQRIASPLRHRAALAGQQGLIRCTLAVEHAAVGRNRFAGSYSAPVSPARNSTTATRSPSGRYLGHAASRVAKAGMARASVSTLRAALCRAIISR